MNTPHLSEHELHLISFKLASDNNAMLRILLENQLKIMDAIGISDAATKFSFESVCLPVINIPESNFPFDELSRAEYEGNITAANIISKKIRTRSWEWVQLKESKDIGM